MPTCVAAAALRSGCVDQLNPRIKQASGYHADTNLCVCWCCTMLKPCTGWACMLGTIADAFGVNAKVGREPTNATRIKRLMMIV